MVFSAIPESQLALTVVEGFTIAKLFDIDGGGSCRCEVAALFKFPQVGVARRYFRTYDSIRPVLPFIAVGATSFPPAAL